MATIGPIRRKETEFTIAKSIITNILNKKGNILLIEKTLYEKDLGWGEVFWGFESRNILPSSLELARTKTVDPLKNY